MRRTPSLLVVLVATALLLSGCGPKNNNSGSSNPPPATASVAAGATVAPEAAGLQCPTSNTITFAKTKFALHAGLAFGTFHRYIYKPFRAGAFHSGAHGRIVALLKAGAAALFDKREIRLAIEDVKANPTLCRAIAAPLSHFADSVSSLGLRLRGGDTSGIEDANGALTSAEAGASAQGAAVQENQQAGVNG